MKNIEKTFISGTAGFIGFHQAKMELEKGRTVFGFDNLNDYYDVNIKKSRIEILQKYDKFEFQHGNLEDYETLSNSLKVFNPSILIHLAAQAGVRYSIENPRAYIESNILGTFNILEACREIDIKHLLMASTSSVYGAGTQMPFNECQKTNTPLSVYSATKKSTEALAHSYSHIWGIPITMLRFFTVYGTYGRPDLALFKFVKAILNGNPIDIYNFGKMERDFTYIDDLVTAISRLTECVPTQSVGPFDSISPVAPCRTVNIGNSDRVELTKFIEAIEEALGIKAKKNFMEIQSGDVPATWADTRLLKELTGYEPAIGYHEGISRFVEWYKNYYKVKS